MSVNNKVFVVCRVAFVNIHGISNKRVRCVCIKASTSATDTVSQDQRGKHDHHNQTNPLYLQLVKQFCESLPTCTSHYSRSKNPDKVYLLPGSTWSGLFEAFRVFLIENGEEPNVIKESRFIKEVQNYKIGLKAPRSDTCNTCDQYAIFLQDLESQDSPEAREEMASLGMKKNDHIFHAEAGRRMMSVYKEDKTPTIFCISIDLQQTLVTPHLTTSAQYYRCKMSTYNLGIHDLKKNKAYFYVWNESEAKRGSCEVASCLNHFINHYVPDDMLKLIIFSDNCAGQNKNVNLVTYYLRLMHINRFSAVTHFFLESGHSYLPCDRDFGVFERSLKGKEVYTTDMYAHLMATHRKKGPVTVVRMDTRDFLDFDVFQQYISKGGQTSSGFQAARRLIISNTFMIGIQVSAGYADGFHEPKYWQMQKGRSKEYNRTKFDLSQIALPVKYPEGVVMNKKKLEHLKDLAKYVPQVHRTYYTQLFEYQMKLTAAESSENVDNPADDILDY